MYKFDKIISLVLQILISQQVVVMIMKEVRQTQVH